MATARTHWLAIYAFALCVRRLPISASRIWRVTRTKLRRQKATTTTQAIAANM